MADTLEVPSALLSASVPVPRMVDVVYLGGAGEESYTVPADTRWVLLSCSAGVYVRVAAAASIPVADVTDGTGSLYINSTAQFEVEEGSVLHFIRSGASATIVTIGRYSA